MDKVTVTYTAFYSGLTNHVRVFLFLTWMSWDKETPYTDYAFPSNLAD
jgi:hypothetical protein